MKKLKMPDREPDFVVEIADNREEWFWIDEAINADIIFDLDGVEESKNLFEIKWMDNKLHWLDPHRKDWFAFSFTHNQWSEDESKYVHNNTFEELYKEKIVDFLERELELHDGETE